MRTRKLSTPAPRTELIASYAYGTAPAAAPPAADAPAAEPAEQSDRVVAGVLAQVKALLAKAIAAQAKDPDATDAEDETIAQGLQSVAAAVDELASDQKDDTVQEDAPGAPPVTAAATQPPASPVDAEGNVDGSAVCANADCQHLASQHLDDDAMGANRGACTVPDCSCLAFQVDAQTNSAGDDQPPQPAAQGAQPSSGSEELAHAIATPDAPVPPGPPATEDSELNQPPMVEGSENMGPAFTIPVGVIEGQPTGDGRQIALDALTWRTPPLPLMGLATETHDPNGFDMNDPAVLCGRIDSLERQPGEGQTQVIVVRGFYLPNDDGQYYASLTEAMGRCGISADIACKAEEIEIGEVDQDGWPSDMTAILTEGEIMGFTQVPFPAFEGAYVVLGDGEEQPDAQPIPQQAEAPPVPDAPPSAVAAGGQLLHLMAYESCEPCEQGFDQLVASGGPAAPPSAWFADPAFTEGDGRLVEILDRRGQRALGGKYACPLTITDEGRVYGHLAPWGVCHIGKPGCVTAPESKSDYAYFKRGQHVITAEGERIRVGALTVNAGHADINSSPTSAMAHYDNIATTTADLNVGQDEYGIWVAGALRPSATDAQVRALRASSISGDWRALGGSLELVAALAVPVPGFPHAVVAGAEQEVLVAAGSSVMHRLKHPAEQEPEPVEGDAMLRRALSPLLSTARQSARERISALRS